MASTLVQAPSAAPISFALNHPRNVKLWASPLLTPRPTALASPPAATHSPSTTPTPASHLSSKHVSVIFADDKSVATSITPSADIDRLLSTAPTAIPRPIAFVQPQKEANARPQHSTPISAPNTPTATTPALPTTQRATSSPITPTPSAGVAAVKPHGLTNGIHAPLATNLTSSSTSPRLSPFSNATRVASTASPTTAASSPPADDNTFHPALHQLFPPLQLPALSQWPAAITGPGTGFQNLGNSCFMNATLQALTHTPMLANYCLSHQHSQHCQIKNQKPLPLPPPPPAPSKPVFAFGMWRPSLQSFQSSLHQQQQPKLPFCLFCVLEENIVRSFKQSAAFAPSVIFHRLPTISRSLRPGRQEDAHEFLRLAFDMLQSNLLAIDLPSRPALSSSSPSCTSLSSKVLLPLPLPKGSSVPPSLFATLTPAQLHRIKETSVLYQIFSGYYRSTLTCRSCHQPSHTFEPFLDLSLSIPTSSASSTPLSSNFHRLPPLSFNRPFQPAFSHNQPPQPPLTLHQCLRAFTSEEQLDTDNMYKCTACKKKTRASKRLTIHTAPNVLVVHLKRFEHSGLNTASGGGKIGRMVRFETVLDIGEYMSERGDGRDAQVEYELYGVLVHAGSTLYSGHYYSFVKAADGRWYEMNDSSVQRRTVEEVLAQKAYILFYTRKVIDTGVKGAAAAGSVMGGAVKVKEAEKAVEKKKERAAAPLSAVNGAVRDGSADELIRALMKGNPKPDATSTPHLNGHSVKVADEKKELPSERAMVQERKEERKRAKQEEKDTEQVLLSVPKPVERVEESRAADVEGADEQKEVTERREEKKVEEGRISLATSTIHQTTVRISLLTPPSSTFTTQSQSSPSSLLRQPSSPLSPPSALSSPTSSTASSKRKQMNGLSPPPSGLYAGMPSFRAGSQAKFTAFATAAANGNAVKKVKRELIGNGVGVGIRLVPYSSSSSDEDEQQDERKAPHTPPQHSAVQVHEESRAEPKEECVPPTQVEEKVAADPVESPPASIPAPMDERKSEARSAENGDRKRRRLDVETVTQTAGAASSNATRFDPHAGRHTARSHYGREVGTWEDDEKGSGTEAERRERDELLRRLERERRGRVKDEYDVMYDEGRKRKVRGDKDEWRGVAVKSGENLLQSEQERRDGRGDRRDDSRHGQDGRRHGDSRSRHSDGDGQRSSHPRHRDDKDGSRNQQHDGSRRHSSFSSHSTHRDHSHSHRHRRDDDRDHSRHSWSHRR